MSKPTTESTQATAGTTTGAGPQSTPGPDAARARSPWELPFTVPFAMPMPEIVGQMMRDQIARTHAAMSELAAYEGIAVQRARTAVDDLARLAGDSIGYVAQLGAEWRKLSLEAVQRTADAFAPRS